MSVRLFNVAGAGYVIGEVIDNDKESEFIHLKYPAHIQFIPDQQVQGRVNIVCDELVQSSIGNGSGGIKIFRDHHLLMEKFPLRKSMIVFKGKPSNEFLGLYEKFAASYRQKQTGIVLAGPGALNNLGGRAH